MKQMEIVKKWIVSWLLSWLILREAFFQLSDKTVTKHASTFSTMDLNRPLLEGLLKS